MLKTSITPALTAFALAFASLAGCNSDEIIEGSATDGTTESNEDDGASTSTTGDSETTVILTEPAMTGSTGDPAATDATGTTGDTDSTTTTADMTTMGDTDTQLDCNDACDICQDVGPSVCKQACQPKCEDPFAAWNNCLIENALCGGDGDGVCQEFLDEYLACKSGNNAQPFDANTNRVDLAPTG